MYKKAYMPFNLIHTWKNNKAGMIRSDGKVVVPNEFTSVESTGYNGICVVSKMIDGVNNFGVYKEDVGLLINTVFSKVTTAQNIPITYFYREVNGMDDWWILGNDGRAYKKISDAFILYKLNNINSDVYKVNIYGFEHVVDKDLRQLNNINIENQEWIRV